MEFYSNLFSFRSHVMYYVYSLSLVSRVVILCIYFENIINRIKIYSVRYAQRLLNSVKLLTLSSQCWVKLEHAHQYKLQRSKIEDGLSIH